MKKKYIHLVLLLMLSFTMVSLSTAQLNKKLLGASLFQFGAGIADGTNQAYLFHYDKDKFWGIPSNNEAWVNKWAKDVDGNPIVGEERFWQSSRALVFTTDFHHATRFAESRFNEASALTYAIGYGKKKKKWYWYLADFAIMFSARSTGFYVTYDVIFK